MAERVRSVALVVGVVAVAVAIGPMAVPSGAASRSAAAVPLTLPAAERRSPAVASMAPGRIDVFTRSAEGRLIQQSHLDGGSWRRPFDRGGRLRSQPAVVSWGPGRLDVFARGTDDRLWHRRFEAGSWAPWEQLGGRLSSAPAVASRGAGRLDVFARNGANELIHKTFSQGVWSRWHRLGGRLTSSPAAAAPSSGRVDVVVRGRRDSLQHIFWASGRGWSGWQRVGSGLSAQPAMVSPAPDQLDVVVRRAQGRLEHLRVTTATGWSGAWEPLGTAAFTSGPAATVRDGDVVVVARRSVGLNEKILDTAGGTWSGWRRIGLLWPYRGLATWVDVFDYPFLDPAPVVADLQARGVRTLLLSTGRFNSAQDFFDEAEMADWLDSAHAAGIKVVGWYVPAYGDMERDVRRVVAIDRYVSPNGQRFDGIGIDIERYGPTGEVDLATFNSRVGPHLRRVRAGTTAALASIVPSPYGTDRGKAWEGFPWSAIARRSDVVVPMILWSYRDGFSAQQVRSWVHEQIDRTQALTGLPVHVEGGVQGSGRTPVTADRMRAFVDGALAAGAIGGSNYDYLTTDPAYWPILAGLED